MDNIEAYKILKEEAFCLCDKGNLSDGAMKLQDLVELARKIDNKAYLVDALTEYAGLIKYLERYDEAESTFIEAKAIIENDFDKDVTAYSNCLVNLANFYRMMHEYEKSEEYFINAKNLKIQQGQTKDDAYVSLQNNLALLYQEQGRYAEALNLHEENLKYLQNSDTPNYQKGTSLNNIASLYLCMGENDKAYNATIRSLEYYADLDECDPLRLAALNSQAIALLRKGDYCKSAEIFTKLAPLCKSAYGENSSNYKSVVAGIEICSKKTAEGDK